MLFLGRFHPLLVHLPIGCLVLLGALEAVAQFTRRKDATQNSPWILGFVCATAIVSAACGWMLASSGGYDAQLLAWHRALGLGLAVACLLMWLFRQREWLRAYRMSLIAGLVLLVVTGHLGGSLTHGRGFLTRHAPAALRPQLGYAMSRDGRDPGASPVMQQPVFAGIVQPILQERCVACHNAEKHKAQLRLDNLTVLFRGGQDGPVIKAGQTKESSLIQRMLLPLEADGHMPPEGQSQPTAEEIAVLEWWVNIGAPAEEKLTDLKVEPELLRLVGGIVSGRIEPAKVRSTVTN